MPANLLPTDGCVTYLAGHFSTEVADALFIELDDCLDWSQETAFVFGRNVPLARLTAWYGPTSYTYSGITHPARSFPPVMQHVVTSIEPVAGDFNCVLANLYRDGNDSVSWHGDNEVLWGDRPMIVSVSFGATRRFVLRHNLTGQCVSLELEHGSLLAMSGDTQHRWSHTIPKTRRVVGRRINLTFRRLATAPG